MLDADTPSKSNFLSVLQQNTLETILETETHQLLPVLHDRTPERVRETLI